MADAVNQAIIEVSNSKTEDEEIERISKLRGALGKPAVTSFKVMVETDGGAPISLQDYSDGKPHGKMFIAVNYDGEVRETPKWSPVNINNYYDLFREYGNVPKDVEIGVAALPALSV
ncbi:MAG: hypothetical protein GY742_11955 [Hyphomicrobiales bacterium]|nr:hypothetical protein [Hyphomicrobiales bacterium]